MHTAAHPDPVRIRWPSANRRCVGPSLYRRQAAVANDTSNLIFLHRSRALMKIYSPILLYRIHECDPSPQHQAGSSQGQTRRKAPGVIYVTSIRRFGRQNPRALAMQMLRPTVRIAHRLASRHRLSAARCARSSHRQHAPQGPASALTAAGRRAACGAGVGDGGACVGAPRAHRGARAIRRHRPRHRARSAARSAWPTRGHCATS